MHPRASSGLSTRTLRAEWLRSEQLAHAAVEDDPSDEEGLEAAYAPRNYKASFLAAASGWSLSPPRNPPDYSVLRTSPPPSGPDDGMHEAAAAASSTDGGCKGRKKKRQGNSKQVLFATNARRLY